jgi:hypothetical protein
VKYKNMFVGGEVDAVIDGDCENACDAFARALLDGSGSLTIKEPCAVIVRTNDAQRGVLRKGRGRERPNNVDFRFCPLGKSRKRREKRKGKSTVS